MSWTIQKRVGGWQGAPPAKFYTTPWKLVELKASRAGLWSVDLSPTYNRTRAVLEIKSWETDGRLAGVTVGTKEIQGPGNTLPPPEDSVSLASGEPVRLTGCGPLAIARQRLQGTERRLWIRTTREKGCGRSEPG